VILDEASSIDQPLAATALLRGRRAVITGDPRQLRQVSFVSDAQLREAVAAHGLAAFPTLASRLDVRRNSTFDLAAGVCSPLLLDEHFRSDPHLIDFVARRLYDGKVRVATRSPTTECRDCVDLVRTDGRRDKKRVVRAEVERVVVELKALLAARANSVGVVTPFRPQADAIEEAALAAFTADELEALDLRVGTVHAFQGNERDVMIASMGLGPDDGPRSWRFVEDPHLFAVFMTRARRRMTILYSADPPADGLVAAYLAEADSPPGRPDPACAVDLWTAAIAEDLALGLARVDDVGSAGARVDDVGSAGARVADLSARPSPAAGPTVPVQAATRALAEPAGPALPRPAEPAPATTSARGSVNVDPPLSVAVVTAYPTGRHVVDIVVDDEARDLGIECSVHPDGPDAHIDRHLALHRSGWTLLEAYPSRWSDRRAELVINLLDEIAKPRT
jgi:hypothetical protein